MSLNYLSNLEQENVFYPCMFPFMFLQMGYLGERLVTLQADKWLLSCVDSFMTLQIGLSAKSFTTFSAVEWLFSSRCLNRLMVLMLVSCGRLRFYLDTFFLLF